MVSENTHIYFANRVLRLLADEEINTILSDDSNEYFLGSIFPDILYYSKEPGADDVASQIHGSDGRPTNQLIFRLLEMARDQDNTKLFSLTSGILTHYAADITFHPVIFYYSGKDLEAKSIDKDRSSYRHIHYETALDVELNNHFYLDQMIRPGALDFLDDFSWLGIPKKTLIRALRRQIAFYRLTRRRHYYYLFRVLSRIGLFPARAIGGFHTNLSRDAARLPDSIEFRDVVNGESKKTTIDDLVTDTLNLAEHMINVAYRYYRRQIDREKAEEVIAGQSLETGQVGTCNADIRFYKNV